MLIDWDSVRFDVYDPTDPDADPEIIEARFRRLSSGRWRVSVTSKTNGAREAVAMDLPTEFVEALASMVRRERRILDVPQ